jgi:hypothetical protein
MKCCSRPQPCRGFALVLTLSLLALLMLALVALSAVVKVNGSMATVTGAQTRARQNALLGLSMGRAELQRDAGPDDQVTGMAGITGIAADGSSTTRNWCGVWRNDGGFVSWLTSGAQPNSSASFDPGVIPIVLVGNGVAGGAGTVGASTSHSEHVEAGRIPIMASETMAAPGVAAIVGNYAYVVTDEGAKISAFSPASSLVLAGSAPLLTSIVAGSAQERLRGALETYPGKLPAIISYEQLSLLPTPSSALTQAVLQDNFHHVTLTGLSLVAGHTYSGTINLNTASPMVWWSILETYNAVSGVTPLSSSELSTGGSQISEGFAASTSGKDAGGPFTSVAAFGGSSLLATSLPATISPEEFMAAIGAMFVVRSDTFRLRAYGEAVDPLDGITIEAVAYCEAILQRTADAAPNGMGRKFVVTYFRWLGPDDI